MGNTLQRWPAALAAALICALVTGSAVAQTKAERIRPFIHAYSAAEPMAAVAAAVREKLTGAGFAIAGEYAPYDGARVIIVTNDELKETAARSEFGGYGAIQRVALTSMGDVVQVSYTNPGYMAIAYRLDGDLANISAALESVLGAETDYGSKKGLTKKSLARYHYMFGMEYFDDEVTLAKYASHQEALDAVEAGLGAGAGGASKVYRVDIPGKEQSVFGAALTDACSSDVSIMEEIDFQDVRSTGHLPYDMLVSGNNVYTLHGRFRIAINFPDLSMMGKHSFMGIMCAPKAISTALATAAGNPPKKRKRRR